VSARDGRQGIWAAFGKRAFDVCAAGALFVLASPLLALLAIAVRTGMGRPVFYRQQRPGQDGLPFEIVKLRTMRQARDAAEEKLSDAERLTPLGRWLRRTSLDELPELWNVLKGDMSLVGPRPLLTEYLPLYSIEQRRRHEVRPGITGWAQVNGRNAISWEQKFALDVWYVDNVGFLLDLRILLRTVGQVMTRRGVSAPSHATMPRFTGNDA
jgi:lipopolysaccharide/colanic/teichoic acid biosynthesis glycosyltransferase